MTGVYPKLCKVHCSCMAYGGVWQAGDIGDFLALGSKRHGHVGLTATIFTCEHVALSKSQLSWFGKTEKQLSESYNFPVHI